MSNNKSNPVMSVRLASELDHAFERNGYSAELVKKLSTGDILSKLLPVIQGHADVIMKKHIINCDADPFVPDDWKVEEHTKGGQFEWNTDNVELYLSDEQKKGPIKGNELRKLLKDKPVLNANILDYLLAHSELIPEEWKGKAIFFWGTIYRNSDGDLCVRYLYWSGSEWGWSHSWLGSNFNDNSPAVLSRK